MAKITRALQKIFCGDVAPTNNVAVFGSLKAGTPAYSSDPTTIQSLAAFGQGWSGATVLNQAPALQDMNALQFLFSRQIAYLLQQGVPEYSSTETYYTNSIVQDSGRLYISRIDNNLGNALTTSNWKVLVSRDVVSVTTTYTVLKTDYVVKATGSSSYTVTLPAAASTNVGETHIIKSNMNAGIFLNVAASGGSLIDGQSLVQLNRMDALQVVSDGTQWMVV